MFGNDCFIYFLTFFHRPDPNSLSEGILLYSELSISISPLAIFINISAISDPGILSFIFVLSLVEILVFDN